MLDELIMEDFSEYVVDNLQLGESGAIDSLDVEGDSSGEN